MKQSDYAKRLLAFDKADLVAFILKRHYRVIETIHELKYLRWERKTKHALDEMDAAMNDAKAATTREERMAAEARFDKAMLLSDRLNKESF